MNPRSLLLILTSSGLIVAALITRNGGILALAVPFLSFLLVALLRAPVQVELRASRTLDKSSLLAGEPVRVKLVATNAGDPIANLSLEDTLPPQACLVEGRTRQSLWLASDALAEVTYTFKSARGICTWRNVSAIAGDPLGLFEKKVQLRAPGEVIVRPAPLGIPRLAFRPARTLRSPGQIPVPLAGPGTDFLGVREYQPGDPLRRINWRMVARHPGRLFTNEQERHEVGDFGLILDARQSEPEIFERAVSAAASLAECILREGNRLSLLVFGTSMLATFPGFGKRQLSVVLRSLAGATRSGNLPLDYLAYFPDRLFPNRAVLLMISSVSPGDLSMYGRLRAAGFEVVLISADPVDFAARLDHSVRKDELAIRVARIERRSTLLGLNRLGVHCIDWRLDEPIQVALDRLEPHRADRQALRD